MHTTKNKSLSILISFFAFAQCWAQGPIACGHSHNDYLQDKPFYAAFDAGIRSIEIDVYPWQGKLRVSHTPFMLHKKPNIFDLYFNDKVLSKIRADATPTTFLIDIKRKPAKTLKLLYEELQDHPSVYNHCSNPGGLITIVLTGRQIKQFENQDYHCLFFIDGRLKREYEAELDKNIRMYSMSFKAFRKKWGPNWEEVLRNYNNSLRKTDIPFRLWGVPNCKKTWAKLANARSTLIHIDKIKEFSQFQLSHNFAKMESKDE